MVNICLYFNLNKPLELNKFTIFDVGSNRGYLSENNKKFITESVNKAYKQSNNIILRLLNENLKM